MMIRKSTTSALITLLMFLWVIPASAVTSLTSGDITTLYNQYFNATAFNHVSVHDPSVVVGYNSGGTITGEYSAGATKVYYIFGSHLAWAYSSDLENWTTFTNNINTSYATLFAEPVAWSTKGSTSYSVSGNMWAPDVVWNKQLQKWCMYMSINGDKWYSSIVMLTATTLNGDWTYVGPVVYSGFTSQSEADATDFYNVIDKSTEGFPSRYTLNRSGNHTYGLNAIDPCVLYDANGNLWMTYGSWFGGIYMLRLDGATGLRDYTYTYTTTDGTAADATSDAYQGIKVAGGNHVSGEASYIENINGTYYLFVTNGGLTSTGGYNMRVYASNAVTGPYVDMTGQDARYSSTNAGVGTINGVVGLRLMSYYKWGWMDKGFTAQGHNSAIVDNDGKSFLVYHTRFNDGTEGHQVRVHQLFQTKNGYITAAPFQYAGETLASAPYSATDITGSYSILYHGTGTNYASLECVQEQEIQLNADGTVTGAYTGTWSQAADGPYITITINSVTFQGVLVTQKMEGLDYTTLCFTAVGNDMSVWGYKKAGAGKPFPDDATVAYNANHINGTVPSSAYSGSKLSLPSTGYFGATYTWSWDNALIGSDGTVKTLASNTSTTLTLTITCGDYNYVITYPIQLIAKSIADMIPISQAAVMGTYADKTAFTVATPSGNINMKTGLSLSFYLENITSDWTSIAHSSDNLYKLYLSILHLNTVDYYEAKATLSADAIAAGYTAASAWTIFLNTNCYVTVSFNPDGSISYYKDGVLMLTFPAAATPSYGTGITPMDIVVAVINYYRNGQLIFDTDVKNIVVGYSANLDLSTYHPLDISQYAFYQDYDYYGLASAWTTPNGAKTTIYDATLASNYIKVTTNGGSGNRSAYNTFSGVNTLTYYNFTFDVCMTSGSNAASVNQVALISTGNSTTANTATAANYIFYLQSPAGSGVSTYYVNNNSSTALTIASGTWITISGDVDVNNKTANVTIINRSTGSTIYSGTTAVNGNGLLKGLWVLAGRGTGTISIDNIKVKSLDLIAPVAPTLADVTSVCSATVTAPTTTDNYVGTVTGTTTTTFPITTQGTTVITWTFNDGNGNKTTATQNVILSDATAPVPDVTILPDITSECSVSNLTAPTATDNCIGTVTGTTTQTFPIASQGTTIVTWTYNDGHGNSITQNQNVIIKDVTSPDVPTLSDVTAECSVASLTAPTTTDNCAGTITGTTTQTFPITSQGTTNVTWTFDDGNGNSTTAIQKVVIADVTSPDVPTLSDVIAECLVASLTAPTTTDNCAGTITGTTTQTFPITTQGTTNVTWTFDDGNSNSTTAIQKVVIADITSPEVPTLSDVIAECSVASLTAPTTTDNCAGTITGTTTQTFPITSQGTTNVTWTFDDGNGNSTTAIQKVVIADVTSPDVPTLSDVTAECSVALLTAPTTTDNCAGTITGTTTQTFPITSQGTTNVTWTFDDGNGNTTTAIQKVVIADITSPDVPTLSDVTAECSVASLTAPTTTDNCAGTITGTTTQTFPITTQGNTNVTWTFDDGNGNTTTAIQKVIIKDVTSPDVPTLSDVTAECSVTSLTAPTTTDNCAGTITGTTTQTFPITTQGNTNVTWTFDDGNGNTTTAIQKVIIKDVTSPDVPTLSDVTAECSVASLTSPTTTDNCAGTITGTTTQTFPITTQGTTNVTWTFDDGNGNNTTAIQKVVIADITSPDVPTLSDVMAECSVASLASPTTTDNCAGMITGTTTQTFPISTQGSTNVTWTFDDGNGNTITAIQKVVIADVTSPDVPTLSDVTAECSVASLTAPTTTDNCAGTLTGTTTQTFPITAQGTTNVIWTFDDGNGNSVTAIQKVIIEDVTNPEIPILEDITSESSVASLTIPTTTDNCAGAITGTTTQTFPITAKGITNVVWIFDDGNGNSIEVIQKVIIAKATNISDVASKNISIYPNPTAGIVYLNFSTLDVKKVYISDITGNVIMEKSVPNQQESIDISSYSNGIYLINIQLEKEVITKKIIKK